MKAIVCTKYGPPEVLQLKELEKPKPKNNEVLIKIYATAVTASDSLMRRSDLPIMFSLMRRLAVGLTKPRKPIWGFVLAGEVEAVGKDVKLFKTGDQVYGSTGMRLGAYAEYACMPEAQTMTGCIAMKPATMSYEEAAAVPYGAMLASHFMNKGNIRSGQKMLVYGASGAIGTTAVQLARYLGAEVTGVCSTANLQLVKSLGADKVIDYTREDSIGSLELYDFVLDAVGRRKSSKLKVRCKKALTQNGKYISVDGGMPWPRVEYLVQLKQLIEAGHFRAAIDRCYPLEEIVEAHRYVDEGHKKGNVVITVGHSNKN
ncbi:MAG TPA: NAD(P)-dependent alcohol dehydrogenase [Pyrinomonadaceae bacterium]|jgi:NADPH:quinone reductase-like Zn-dependent oxidoreductase|nr:NAD(P)-dependent alcohol dehydrogenase [Pyrinomonadaceae bacterium]